MRQGFYEDIYARHEVDLEGVSASLSSEERNTMYEGLKKLGQAAKTAALKHSKETKQDASA